MRSERVRCESDFVVRGKPNTSSSRPSLHAKETLQWPSEACENGKDQVVGIGDTGGPCAEGGGGNEWVRASRDAPSLGDCSLITTVSPMPQPHGSEHVVGC